MKYSLVGSVSGLVLGTLSILCPGSALAGWGHLRGGSSGGSSGYSSYGSSGGSSGYSSYGSSGYSVAYGSSGYSSSGGSSGYTAYSSSGGSSGGGHVGLFARLHAHMAAKHARHAARRAAHASSGGSSGYGSSGGYSSYGSSGGYSTYYGSSGGAVSYGSSGGSSGSVYYGASSQTTSRAASMVSNVEASADSVYLTVAVPTEAKVFVNENPTTSTGAVRKFVSRGLQPGKSYRFQLRAELMGADGQAMVEEKTVVVTAGERQDVQFAFTENASAIETAVTLNVPEDAKVYLSGNETKITGSTRTFRTSRLKPGQVWDDYQIEVRHGDSVKQQTVRLIAGDQLQLTFDFEQAADRIASK
jgi:uncharacterized protein (TIGR03000 family)